MALSDKLTKVDRLAIVLTIAGLALSLWWASIHVYERADVCRNWDAFAIRPNDGWHRCLWSEQAAAEPNRSEFSHWVEKRALGTEYREAYRQFAIGMLLTGAAVALIFGQRWVRDGR